MLTVEDVDRMEREAHEGCLVKRDRLCEQTCEMPDGPATSVCDEQHASIQTLASALREALAEVERLRGEAHAKNCDCCGEWWSITPRDRGGCQNCKRDIGNHPFIDSRCATLRRVP